MTSYTLPLLVLLILAPLAASAAPDTPGQGAERREDATGAPKDAGAPAARPEGKPKAAAPADPQAKGKPGEGKAAPTAQPVVDAATTKTATETATAYLTALKDKGFAAAPAWLHPSALARFKELVMPRLKDEQARGTRTLLNATFGRDASYPLAAAADPADFLTRFARLISAREPEAAPRFSALAPIGVLREGEQLHVLIRLTQGSGATAVERVEVVSLLPLGPDWKVDLDGRLQTLASTLAGTLAGGAGGPGGERPRTAPPRPVPPRMEPLPEGLPSMPPEPQGPAGLLPLPPPTR